MDKLLTQRNTVVLVAVLTLWRLYLSATLQLHPDEAYYWLWSRYLDLGYFDHPPLVAYFIWLSTRLSHAEFWVRLSGTVVLLVLSGLMWQFTLRLYNNVTLAAASVVLFNVFPVTMLGLIVITPDVPLLLFCALCILIFWQAVQGHHHGWWYLLGVSFGLALLSKYTAILLAPCFFLYLLLTEDRRWLKTIYPYVGLLIGILIFLPVLWWNSQHGWVSFGFQLRNGLGGEDFAVEKVAEYAAGQLLIAGPVAWFVGLWAVFVAMQRKDRATLLLVCTAVPIFLFFGLSSLRKVAGPNWPAFAYFSFSILITQYCLHGNSKVRRALWSAAVASSLALSLVVTLHARFGVLGLERYSGELAQADATNWFHGWRELGVALKNMPDINFAVTPSHQLSAEIIYYTNASISARTTPTSRPSQFNLLDDPQGVPLIDPVYVWTSSDFMGHEPKIAALAAGSRILQTYREGRVVRTYHIVSGLNATWP